MSKLSSKENLGNFQEAVAMCKIKIHDGSSPRVKAMEILVKVCKATRVDLKGTKVLFGSYLEACQKSINPKMGYKQCSAEKA